MSEPNHNADPGAEPAPPDPDAERLGRLEQELEALERVLGGADWEAHLAALEAFEFDLFQYACDVAPGGTAREHPVQGVALGWEERLRRSGRHEDAKGVEQVAAEVQIRALRERERPALDALEGPAEALTADIRDRLLESTVAVEELRMRVEGRADALGPSKAADARAVCDEARQVGIQLRSAFERAATQVPGNPAARKTWVGRWIDLADETMLGAGERAPGVCARQLGEVVRALEWHRDHIEKEPGVERKRLERRIRRVELERIEQHLQARLERRFGERAVELWERSLLVALVLVVVLLFVDVTRGATTLTLYLDTALCGFFLTDFFVKAATVGFHPLWLRRHVFTDLVPALPYAWFASLDGLVGDTGRLSRLLRLLRVFRVAQYLKLALPVIRLFRAMSFLVRGLDRLVRRNSKLLEGAVLLFPTLEERRRGLGEEVNTAKRRWRLRSDLDGLFEQLFEGKPDEGRKLIVESRLRSLRRGALIPFAVVADSDIQTTRRAALPLADAWLQRLSTITSEEVEGRVGREAVRRIARGSRLVARSPLRLAPGLGGWAPSDAADLPDRRVASRTIRNIARSMTRMHRRVLWWADLRGTLTPGELVGRVGATLVARTARPAVRLLMIGALVLVLSLIAEVLGIDLEGGGGMLRNAVVWASSLLKGGLIALGAVCLAFLAVGVWLQRIARDATTYHEKVARAQFLHLTDSIKARQRAADAGLMSSRVFRLERNLNEADGASEAAERDGRRFMRHLERFLAEGTSPPSMDNCFDPVARAVMLHRDLLDGALLAHTDTRATSQLLGNLAIQRMVRRSGRVGKRLKKTLVALDLERRRTFLAGPYLWFHSISRALSSRAARLIVDYNAHAIPLSELDRAGARERRLYERWLAGEGTMEEEGEAQTPGGQDSPQLTTAFTILHVLDNAPGRDAEVAARFGAPVLRRLRRDRRALVRTVFGTYPLHELPLEQRILNLRATYADWVEGGRVLLIPFRVTMLAFVGIGKGTRSLVNAVRAIRRPERFLARIQGAEADFTAAARKIDRMRAPGAQAALHLRAIFDPEYHGLPLPFGLHDEREASESSESPAQRDAKFLRAEPAFLDHVTALGARASRSLLRLERAVEGGLVERLSGYLGVDVASDPETLRALVLLVHGDDGGIGAQLFGPEILTEGVLDALEYGSPPRVALLPRLALRFSFERWWRKEGGRESLVSAVSSSGILSVEPPRDASGRESRRSVHEKAVARRVRRAAWRVVAADVDGARAALGVTRARTAGGAAASQEAGEARLAEALRHPSRVSEQLITLRIVQTLGLVDVRNYRRHVWSLGQYDGEADPGDVLLDVAGAMELSDKGE